jgi:hypothetical protein
MKISKARMIIAPMIAPIRTPLADDFVVLVEVLFVVVIPVFLVVVPAAGEVVVVVVVLARLAKTAKVLKWSTEAVIV